jgi:glutathione S-transferase
LLIGIRYSPWTERARWALDHHGLEYRYEEHLILLGMPGLRFKTGRWKEELTLPLLIEGDRLELDSFDIAHYGDEKGTGAKLIEGVDPSALADCVADAEVAAEALRARLCAFVLADERAQRESSPPWVPSFAREAMRPVVRMATRYIEREFDVTRTSPEDWRHELRGALNRMRWKLTKSQFRYMVGDRFSYADIVSCGALQAVKPVSDAWLKLTPSMREGSTDAEFARDFSDLVQWRDRIYEKHRGRRAVRVTG